jgi:hypothetical protein
MPSGAIYPPLPSATPPQLQGENDSGDISSRHDLKQVAARILHFPYGDEDCGVVAAEEVDSREPSQITQLLLA